MKILIENSAEESVEEELEIEHSTRDLTQIINTEDIIDHISASMINESNAEVDE